MGWASPPLSIVPLILGFLLVSLGLILWFKTITLFASIGEGTLAPWDPPQKLVIHGVYKYVRNPMIVAVCCVLLGEATILGSIPLLDWLILFFLLHLIYLLFMEEPDLIRRCGDNYILYKMNVPRWFPRLSPWEGLLDDRATQ